MNGSGAGATRRRIAPATFFFALAFGPTALEAQPLEPSFPREGPVLYRQVPDIPLSSIGGDTLHLAELWQRRPLIVTLVFERCRSICPFYLRSLRQAVAAVGGAGADFDVLVISFDPTDTPEGLRRLAKGHGLLNEPGWTFAVTPPAASRRLAEAIGFWIEGAGEGPPFDHPAMLAAVDRGTVVRLLAGATVHERRLREVVWELGRVPVPTYPLPSEKIWFRCFDYDPEGGGLRFDWGLLLLLAPGLVMFLSAALIFRGSPRGRKSEAEGPYIENL